MAKVTKKKHVRIDVGYNETWEVQPSYPLEKGNYWWTKSELEQIRNDYKDEVMMEGVRNLVKTRIEQEEDDMDIIKIRLEEIMTLDPGSIATFLQSEVEDLKSKPNQKAKMKTKTKEDMSNNSNTRINNRKYVRESKNNYVTTGLSSSYSESITDSDSDYSSLSSTSTSSSLLDITCYSSSSSLSLKNTSRRSSIDSESEPITDKKNSDFNTKTLVRSNQHDQMVTTIPNNGHILTSDDPINLEKNKNDEKNKTDYSRHGKYRRSTLINFKGAKKLTNPNEIGLEEDVQIKRYQMNDNFKLDINRNSLGNRFRQGVWAVIAMERLEKIVKQAPPPPPTPANLLSLSSRLVDMYLPSDEENEDDDESSDDEYENSKCPVCLGLVTCAQHRKIILLRRMLCKRCFDMCYIQRGVINGKISGISSVDEGSKSTPKDEYDLKMKKDVRIIFPLREELASTHSKYHPVPKRKQNFLIVKSSDTDDRPHNKSYYIDNSETNSNIVKCNQDRNLKGKSEAGELRSTYEMKTNCRGKERRLQRTKKSVEQFTSRRKKTASKQSKDTTLFSKNSPNFVVSPKKESRSKEPSNAARYSNRFSKADDAMPFTFRTITENEIKVSRKLDKNRIEEKLLARQRAT